MMKLIFSSFLFLLSFSYSILAFGLVFLKDGKPGPGFLPTIVGILLVIFTGMTLYQVIKEWVAEKRTKNVISEEEEKSYFKDVIYIIVMVALFVLFLRFLGGLISMILFSFGVLYILNRGKHLQNILTSTIIPIAIFSLFELWLNAGIPKGILDIF